MPRIRFPRELARWLEYDMYFRPHRAYQRQEEKRRIHYPLAAALATRGSRVRRLLRIGEALVLNSLRLRGARKHGAADILVLTKDAEVVLIEVKYDSKGKPFHAAGQLESYIEWLRAESRRSPDGWVREIFNRSYAGHAKWAREEREGTEWTFEEAVRKAGIRGRDVRSWQRRLAGSLERGTGRAIVAWNAAPALEPLDKLALKTRWRTGALICAKSNGVRTLASAAWSIDPGRRIAGFGR